MTRRYTPRYTLFMPYKDPKKHRDYYRDYMRRRRAEQVKPKPQTRPGDKAVNAELVAELARLKAENAHLKAELASERSRSKPKAPLPPDEARERTIKGLRTRVRNLEAACAAMAATANMPRTTQNAIAKTLHPDRKLSEAEREAERETALKLFTAWKADKDKAARKARE